MGSFFIGHYSFGQKIKFRSYHSHKSALKYIDDQSKTFNLSGSVLSYISGSDSRVIEIKQIDFVRKKSKETYKFQVDSVLNKSLLQGTVCFSNLEDVFVLFCYNISLDSNYLYIFSQKLQSSIKIPFDKTLGIRRVDLLSDSTVLLSHIYNYHPNDVVHKTYIGVYNFKTRNLLKENNPIFRDIGFSHKVGSWIDSKTNFAILSQSTSYLIEGIGLPSLQNQILVNETNNEGFSPNKLEYKLDLNSRYKKNLISQLNKLDETWYRIEKVFLLDSNQILVSVKRGNTNGNDRFLDLWNKTNTGWNLNVESQKNIEMPFLFFSRKSVKQWSWSCPTQLSTEYFVFQSFKLPIPIGIAIRPIYKLRTMINYMSSRNVVYHCIQVKIA
ncbi:MAG: hypothetical protein KDC83_12100 [Flavobacteriales bacterium]|nr:hypothetical protein [Flavobacteriales bacterium]